MHERLDALEALNRKNAEELVRRHTEMIEERFDELEAKIRRNDLAGRHLEQLSLRRDPLIEIMFFRIQLALETIDHLEEVFDAIAEKINRF